MQWLLAQNTGHDDQLIVTDYFLINTLFNIRYKD